jgi:hypothetical protein
MISSPLRRASLFWAPCILLAFLAADAQENPVPARITQAVNEQVRVTLRGNTHPLARAEYDRGLAPDDLPLRRMLLLLKRSPEQQLALAELLDEQQDRSSANYHHWLTPQEFGERFGPADEDVQAVTDWLRSQGFQVDKVAAGRTAIEFSGTVGEVRAALRTEIHRYSVNHKSYWANAADPQIPAALAPVVAGVVSLNNFPRKPFMHSLGTFARSQQTGQVEPLFTLPYYGSNYYILGPYDFATVYNVLPLWNSGIDGTGVTIAIVGETNINLNDAANFRSMWDLPPNPPQVILNGPDPGIVAGDESEASTDVQWAGAVAKGATIDLVVSESTETTYGTDLSALYIVDNNIAPIMSESYGACEAMLGTAGNAFYSSLYQQGAAEGITILVSSGDSGSDACDFNPTAGTDWATTGLSVNGIASTPFNVVVGGTDFNDVSNPSTYWRSTNNSINQSSAKSYIPEQTWNGSCARLGLNGCANLVNNGLDLLAAGGGPSNCSTLDASGTCVSGYAKPAWQTGAGVPSDGARDLPDVSLFSAAGTASNSFYPYCQEDVIGTTCGFYTGFLGAGGTSISAQAFAGVMALIVQKTGERQGNANYVLYPLAAQSGASCKSDSTAVSKTSCVFYDTTVGNISVACLAGSPNCSNQTSGYGVLVDPHSPTTPAWTTTGGYDRATGLGSVNVANLANKWTSVSFSSTSTTLSLSTTPPSDPLTVTHGQPVNFNISVTSTSGTPTGAVSLMGGPNNTPLGIDFAALSGGAASGSTVFLPGGSYGVTAHYAGDGKFGASDSTPPVQVTVNPESSLTKVGLVTFDYTTGYETSSNATTAPYGSPYLLRVDVTNASGKLCAPTAALPQYACPSGNVALTDNGAALDLGSYPLNSQGYLEDQPVQLPGGSHSVVANYGGDRSYNASTATASISIAPAQTTTALSGVPPTILAGAYLDLRVTVNTQSSGVVPSGVPQLYNGTTLIPAGGGVGGSGGSASGPAYLTADLNPILPPGNLTLTAKYLGDINYAPSTSAPASIRVTDFTLSLSPTTLTIPAPGQSATSNVTLTPLYGFTGTVSLNCDAVGYAGITCVSSPATVSITGTSPVTATLTISTTAPTSAARRVRQVRRSRVFPILRISPRWSWIAAGLLAVALMIGLAISRRREAAALIATALLVAGAWVACGSGGGGTNLPSSPKVSLSPTSLDFGDQAVSVTSPPQYVTLTNVGNANLLVTGLTPGGANPYNFAASNNCLGTFAPHASCIISISFTPPAAGPRSATLSLTDNASDSPQTIALSGNGVQPTLSVSPDALTFGQQLVLTASAAQTVTLSNTGSAPVSLYSVSNQGANTADFQSTSNCGLTIAVGVSCQLSVTFAPSAAGSRTTTLTISDNASGSPQTVSLTGAGILPPTPPGTYYLWLYANGQSGGNTNSHVQQITVVVQ